MSKELMLFCNADGKWAVYDDTFDITIHCESKQEQDKAMEMIHKVNRPTEIPVKMAADAIVKMCRERGKFRCKGCVFAKDDGRICPLNVPEDWGI